MQYAYSAKSSAGETVTGVLTADTPEQARRHLRERSLFPLAVKPYSGSGKALASGGARKRGKVSKRDLLTLTSQLAIMTRAGIDLAGAYQSLHEQCTHRKLKETLRQIHTDLTGGKSVSDALRAHAPVFGAAYVSSVAAGEASGRLPDVFNRLAHLLRSEMRHVSTLRALLAYPIILACVSGLVLMGLILFVLPQFADVFGQFEVALPTITQVFLGISGELRARLWLWIPLGVGAVVGLVMLRLSAAGRRAWDHLVLNAALVRDVSRALLVGRIFRLMGIMIDSGVPLLEALQLTRGAVRNILFQELIDSLEKDILNGKSLGPALAGSAFVPPAAAEMVITAERTGTLPMVTQLIGEHYEEEGESRLRELASMLEPAIIIGMGMVVATVVMSVMLPMFDIATFAQGK